MKYMMRILGVAALLCFVVAGGAQAEKLNAAEWQFAVNFPCKAELGSQSVPTKIGDVVMHTYSCGGSSAGFLTIVSDYPHGFIKQDQLDTAYASAINGGVTNVKGRLRSTVTVRLNGKTGREVVIDVPASHEVAHARFFIIGDRLYQVIYIGPSGSEKSKDCMEFLASFRLK